MHPDIASRVARLSWLMAATFTGFFLLGYGGIFIWSGPADSSSPIWPATAFGFVMILRLSRSRGDDIALLAAILAAGLLANGMGGAPLLTNIGFSTINLLDVVAGLVMVRRLKKPRFNNLKTVTRFVLVAALVPSVMGAVLSSALIVLQGGSGAFTTGLQWLMADILGVLIVFPLGMTVSLRQLAKLRLRRRFLEATLLFSGIALMSYLSFHEHAPLLFLVLMGCMAAGVRFRFLGVGASLIVVAAISFASLHALPGPHSLAWVEWMQFFLAACSFASVRTVLMMNERDLHIALIERRHRRAVRASRFKTQLLAHVSHEVRSPLSAIIGFSSMLESGSLSAARAPEFAAIIAHNGELLQRLHDDLLDLSRAEAGALTLRPSRVAVGQTLRACVGAIRMDASLGGKDVLITPVADSLALTCDPVRLAQILNNLIANAFKYGDNASPIRVSAHALGDGFGRIEIANTGPGIPRTEHDVVFTPFRRSSQVGRHVPGAGLGLSIAKLLVEAQGGRIDFESVPGRQTRFWIDLPLAA